jgi:1,4-alpha-glucan branching enzyme
LQLVFAAGCSAANPDLGGKRTASAATASGMAPSTRPGMGAVVYGGGATFRVWAPNATQVWVRGDFDGWADPGEAMAGEGNGNFSLDVNGAAAGQQYEYEISNGATTVHRADPRSKQVVDDQGTFGNSIVADPNAYVWSASGYVTPDFRHQVIYEMHIGTFDGSVGAGTWASAAQKLDYLAALGVNMLEVLPVSEFQGGYSWGYDPSFLFAPESSYGSPNDMKSFVDQAHARGMGVIVDIVHNHYGPELGRSLWCFDIECYGFGGIYFYSDWRKDTGFGPRPDYGRPQVRDFVVDNAMEWLQEFQVDGLRWDSTINIRQANGVDIDQGWPLLQRINDTTHGAQPWKIMIAEDLQQNAWVTRPTSAGGAGFDSQWETEFFYPMKDTLLAIDDGQRDMNRVAYAVTHSYNGQATQRVIFTENHDQVAPQNGTQRLAQSICPGMTASCVFYAEKRTSLGAAIAMTSPGIPMIFQGQEFVDDTPFPFGRAQGIDWSKQATFAGIVQMYADLVHLRRNANDVTRGLTANNVNVFHVDNGAKVVAYHRWDQGGAGDDVVVVANFSNVPYPSYRIGFPRGGTWHVRFNGDWNGYSPRFASTPSNDTAASGGGQDGLGFSGSVGVGPYSVVILSQ